jgi:hypothetical protein
MNLDPDGRSRQDFLFDIYESRLAGIAPRPPKCNEGGTSMCVWQAVRREQSARVGAHMNVDPRSSSCQDLLFDIYERRRAGMLQANGFVMQLSD